MKIALLMLNQKDHVRRANAFARNLPDHELTYVFVHEPWEIKCKAKFNLSHRVVPGVSVFVGESSFKASDFDLWMPMGDKVCDFLFEQAYPDLININNKRLLQIAVDAFGKFGKVKTSTNSKLTDFKDVDRVILKPAISSGGYSNSELCYTELPFERVKQFFDNEEFIIQQYIPTKRILNLTLISNGKEYALVDVCDQEYLPTSTNNFYSPFMESDILFEEQFKHEIEVVKEFFTSAGFQKYRGFLCVQLMMHCDKMFFIDCNLRPGPVSLEFEDRQLAKMPQFRIVPFLLGEDQSEFFADINNFVKWMLYSEIGGELQTERKIAPNLETRVCIKSDKSSGVFRSDYEVFIEEVKRV